MGLCTLSGFVCSSTKPVDALDVLVHGIVFHLSYSGFTGSFADVSAPLYALCYIETFCCQIMVCETPDSLVWVNSLFSWIVF